MIRLTQLRPQIPVRVVPGFGWAGPTGPGVAIGWFQESIEHSLTFVVALDETGQIWEVEQPNVRMRRNITWGRNSPDGSKEGKPDGTQ